MGLSIPRTIVEAHGGTTRLIDGSSPTTFRFTIPAAPIGMLPDAPGEV